LPWFELNQNVWANIYLGSPDTEMQWGIRFWTPLKTSLPFDGAPKIPGDLIGNSKYDVSGTTHLSSTNVLLFIVYRVILIIS
jgi:hypothetical protein